MAEGFKAAWEPAWDARLDSLEMSRLQLVTLASIVEGEARADDERETIAGVYRNRLRIGMALQADPTVQYAIALTTGLAQTRLYEKDYQFHSPYNTYLNPGLPPGPVNSPSRRSIEASLYPAKVPYLYFVAGPDGRHIFSRTYSEHLRNVAEVRRLRGLQATAISLSPAADNPAPPPRRPRQRESPTPPRLRCRRPIVPCRTSSGRTPPIAMQGCPDESRCNGREPFERRARSRRLPSCVVSRQGPIPQ